MTDQELNRLVAEHVMGCSVVKMQGGGERCDCERLDHVSDSASYPAFKDYVTSIADAWEVVEKMRQLGWDYTITLSHTLPGGAEVRMHIGDWGCPYKQEYDPATGHGNTVVDTEDDWCDAAQGEWGLELPRAICLAALRAKGIEV